MPRSTDLDWDDAAELAVDPVLVANAVQLVSGPGAVFDFGRCYD